jgi:hypothetical protein
LPMCVSTQKHSRRQSYALSRTATINSTTTSAKSLRTFARRQRPPRRRQASLACTSSTSSSAKSPSHRYAARAVRLLGILLVSGSPYLEQDLPGGLPSEMH